MADGCQQRWGADGHLKHLIRISGETLLERTVRLLRAERVEDIWITTHHPAYRLPGVQIFQPTENLEEIDKFYSSSTWRIGGLMFCREKLREWGVVALVCDVTPRLENSRGEITLASRRGDEIRAWIARQTGRREVERFVILDDDGDMGPLHDRLVRTDPAIGLTDSDANTAIAILNGRP